MSADRFRRVDRRTDEQLLDGAPDRTPDALRDLLANAAAPARQDELAGEEAAVAAFRAARLDDAAQPRRESMLNRFFTVKIAAAAVGAMAVGGIAVAAVVSDAGGPSTPNSEIPVVPGTAGSPSSGGPAKNPDQTPAQKDQPGTEKTNGDNKNKGGNDDKAAPSPSLKGLCQAFTAGAGAEHGKALENPAFTVLITTAGGKDKVPAFCATLLADKPGHPNQPNQPDKPGQAENPPGKHQDNPGHQNQPNKSNGEANNGQRPGQSGS